MKKKLLVLGLAFSFLFSAVSVQALTSNELLQISKILGLSDEQTAKLQVLVKEPVKTSDCIKFERDLRIGDKGQDVSRMSYYLNKIGLLNTQSESFNEDVAAAVVKYQGKNGLPMTGFFGPMTRGKINGMICHPYGDTPQVDLPENIGSSTVSSWGPNSNANINAFLNIIKPEKDKKYKLGEKIELVFKSNLSNVEGYVISLRAGGSKEWFMESIAQIAYGKGENLGDNSYKVETVINITPEIKKFMSDALSAGMKGFTIEVAGVKYVKGGFDILKVNTSAPFFIKNGDEQNSSTIDKVEDNGEDETGEVENEVEDD